MKNNFYYDNLRWLVITTLLYFSSSFGQTFFIAIFAGYIRYDFEISHTTWGSIYAIGTCLSAALMFKLGGLTEKFKSVNLGFIIIIGLSFFCLMMVFANDIILLAFIIFGLRFFGQGFASHLSMVLCGRWFSKNRGKSVAFTSLGFAFGEAFLPIIFVSIISIYGWRSTWGIAFIILILISFIIRTLLTHERSPSKNNQITIEKKELGILKKHWTKKDMLKSWVGWPMIIAIVAQSMFVTIFFFQQVTLGIENNWKITQFALLIPFYTTASIFSTFVAGYLVDKLGVRAILPYYLLPGILGFYLITLFKDPVLCVIPISLLGIMQGIGNTLSGTFWPEFFGTKYLGEVRAVATSFMVIASALGPFISGLMLDNQVNLNQQFFLMSILMAISTIGLVYLSIGTKKYFNA